MNFICTMLAWAFVIAFFMCVFYVAMGIVGGLGALVLLAL